MKTNIQRIIIAIIGIAVTTSLYASSRLYTDFMLKLDNINSFNALLFGVLGCVQSLTCLVSLLLTVIGIMKPAALKAAIKEITNL